MAGREIDRDRARSAVQVLKEHPILTLFAVSPSLIPVGLIWWLAGAGWAIVVAVVLLMAGAAVVVRKR
jgi:hypothetical protein